MDSEFDKGQLSPDELYRLAVSLGVRKYTAEMLRLTGDISKPLDPEEAFKGFLERLLESDPIVKELLAHCRASGKVIMCSNDWKHEYTEQKRAGFYGGITIPVRKTNYRFIALTGSGYRVCETILDPTYRMALPGGIDQTPPDASIIPIFSKLNSSHLGAALKAGTNPERVIELLYTYANKLCPPDNT